MSTPLTLSLDSRRAWTEVQTAYERTRRAFTDGSTNTVALREADHQLAALNLAVKALRIQARGEIAAAGLRARSDRRAG